MRGRRSIFLAAFAALLVVAGASAGAQAAGPGPGLGGFGVENLLMELSLFVPEQYAGFRAVFGGPGGQGPGGQGGPGAGAATGAGQQGGETRQRPNGPAFPEFKRDAKLMLTAAQVDALLPVLLDLQKNPFPTPSQAKKITATVDATLTKPQKDAYEKYAKERDKAIEEMRKQAQLRTGTQGQGDTSFQGGPDAPGGQGQPGQQGQRQQMDPAERRKRMLDTFIKNLKEYRTSLG